MKRKDRFSALERMRNRRLPQTAGHGEKRSRKQEAAIAALLSEPSIAAAAHKAGIGERTLRTWLRQPGFRQHYRQTRWELLDNAVKTLQKSCGAAVNVLVRLALEAKSPPAVRLRAAEAILNQTVRGAELLDLNERMRRLEEVQDDNPDSLRAFLPPEKIDYADLL